MLIYGFEMYAGKGNAEKIWNVFHIENLLARIMPAQEPQMARDSKYSDEFTGFNRRFFSIDQIKPVQYFVKSGLMEFVFPFPVEFMLMPAKLRNLSYRNKWKIKLLFHGEN